MSALPPEHEGPCSVELGQALHVLTDALDLVGLDDVHHGKRVAWLTARLLEAAGLPELAASGRDAALVHDCGVSSSRHHRRLVFDLGVGDGHCEVGAQLLTRFQPLAGLAEVIRHHHTPWLDLGRVEPRLALLANAVFLADRLDVLQARHQLGRAEDFLRCARAELLAPHGHLFHPRLVAASGALLAHPELEHQVLADGAGTELPPEEAPRWLCGDEVRELAVLFAHTVDAKSAYTASHSRGVAALALELGGQLGWRGHTLRQLEVAALLHDLGKLRVPDEVLEKPGPLDPSERELMKAHPEDSRRILERIGGFGWIARVAGMHHESLDGSGYARGLEGDQVPLAARIVSVADVFQALAQDRPYRRAMRLEELLGVLASLADAGKLDRELVALVRADPRRCWRVALASERAVRAAG